jgi:hypothetical protein
MVFNDVPQQAMRIDRIGIADGQELKLRQRLRRQNGRQRQEQENMDFHYKNMLIFFVLL